MLKEYNDVKEVDKAIVNESICRRFRISKEDLAYIKRELGIESKVEESVCRRFRISKNDLNEIMRELDMMEHEKKTKGKVNIPKKHTRP